MTINVSDRRRKNVLLPCDHGLMIINRFDRNELGVGQAAFLLDHGNSCTKEAEICYSYLSNIDQPVIFDIGANIGTFTSWLCKIFPDSKIYCFEPQRLVYQMLCGNIAINNWENCYTYNMGMSDVNDIIPMTEPDYYSEQDFGTISLNDPKIDHRPKNFIEVITLDKFVQKFYINKIDFIKIDVEGMELSVLTGAEETLKKFRPAIFIEYSNYKQNTLEHIVELLGQENWRYFVYDNNVLVLPNSK